MAPCGALAGERGRFQKKIKAATVGTNVIQRRLRISLRY